MYKSILLFAAQLLLVSACRWNDRKTKANNEATPETLTTSEYISRDSANKMIASYAESTDSAGTVADLYSVSFDASQLRAYLSDTTITGIKMSLAHKLSYINAGHKGQPAGYRSDALTLVISAYNSSGDFVFHNGQVMDFGAQCPTVCPNGTAGAVLFPVSTTGND